MGEERDDIPNDKKVSHSPISKPQVKNPCTQIFEFEEKAIEEGDKDSLLKNKNFGLKYTEYGSDEFADVEDSSRESSYDDLKTVPDNTLSMEIPCKLIRQGQINETREENSMLYTEKNLAVSSSESIEKKEIEKGITEGKEVHGTKSMNFGASCSYSPPHISRKPKTTNPVTSEERGRKNKCNLPTIVEESDSESGMSLLKDNKPRHSQANPLKIKAKVGIRKDKCNVCRTRLGLCAIKCRCGGYYCAKHRYDKEHNCPFDYRTMGAEEIRRNNPRVIAEKVRKL